MTDTDPPDDRFGIDHQTTEPGPRTMECETCGEEYEEPAGLKAGSECPSCSGGDLS